MKKLSIILLILFLFAGCSADEKSVTDESGKATSDAAIEPESDAVVNADEAEESVTNENPPVEYNQEQALDFPMFTNEQNEILYELRGLFVDYNFMEEFRKTKSAHKACEKLGASEYELLYDFYEDPHGYRIRTNVYYEDCSSRVNDVENSGDGQYIVSFENGGKIKYTPGKKILESTIYGRPMKISEDKYVKYEQFMSYDDFIYQLSKILCENSEKLHASGEYGILGEIGGTRCSAKLVYFPDELETVHYGDERGTVEGIDITGYDGALKIEKLVYPNEESFLVKYKYVDGKLTIFDSKDNILDTL